MEKKREAAVYKTNKVDGKTALLGYNAVDPKGHLVLLPPSTGELPGRDWRWASREDLATAKKAAGEAQAADAPASKRGPLSK